MENIRIRIIMENGRQMEAELYPEVAPKTVENFVKLIKENSSMASSSTGSSEVS